MEIKLNVEILYPIDQWNNLDLKIDSKLNWKSHVTIIATKLKQANTMLYRVRDFINENIPI